MRFNRLAAIVLYYAMALTASAAALAEEPPTEWIDAKTGHRIIRLSKEPGSASLYFHQNAYWRDAPDGPMMIFTTSGGISAVNLKTRQIQPVVQGEAGQQGGLRVIVVGRKSGDVYYIKDRTLFATNIATRATRQLAKIPEGGSVSTINADETLAAGAVTEGDVPRLRPKRPTSAAATEASSARNSSGSTSALQIDPKRGETFAQAKEVSMDQRLALKIPMSLVTIDLKTGESKTFNRCTDWLNHFQFSPTDPGLLMFCHEGPWHKVDRIWTIRTDGSEQAGGARKVHPRTMNMEIFGHEFWSADGKTIWYDLQTPRGEVFWLAGLNLETGRRIRYHLERNEWSVHFNISPDGKLFAGDGGDNEMVAHAPDGKWIYLFRPQLLADQAGDLAGKDELIQPGVLRAEKLVDMSKHDYRLEPNVTFTPDMKYIVFRSNMLGAEHVFAVEIASAN